MDAKTRMPPRKEQVDAILGNEASISEQGEYLVSEQQLGSMGIDVGNGKPLAVGCPHAPGSDGVDVGVPLQR